ncbi:MAG: ABC transporter permease [Armatimonadota bacterium]|nr:ABC transporter permease [Armatimonadota bacterium]MDW8105058.1 ABC transporter permease [Armatimonadota bacterium]
MSRTWTVFWKELREVLRDRRVLFSTVVSPLLLTPLLLWGIGLMVQQRVESARKVTIPTAVVAPRGGDAFLQALQENAFTVQRVAEQTQAKQMLRQRQVWMVVVLDERFDERLQNESTAQVTVLYDPLNESSREAVQRLKALTEQLSAQWVQQRLARRFIGVEFTQPLALVTQPIETENPVGNLILSIILPYVIVLSGFFGAVSPAFDLIAGEKERGTLETLLATPASRRQIVWGKFLTVTTVCMVAALFAMLGMLLAFSLPASSHLFTEQVGKFSLPPAAMVALVITLLPLSVFYSAILTIISTFARNQKEAQTYLIPLSTLIVLPAVASMFARTESGLWLAMVPILNSAMTIKQVLTGVLDPLFVSVSLLVSGLVAIVSLQVATRLFDRETVLLSS